jgi:hypothetical protein
MPRQQRDSRIREIHHGRQQRVEPVAIRERVSLRLIEVQPRAPELLVKALGDERAGGERALR